MILMFALMAMMFSSCSSDDKDESYSLNGTTWVADEGSEEVFTLIFSKSTFKLTFVYDENLDGIPEEKEETSGNYVVEGTNVALESNGEKVHGVISGSKMTFRVDGDVLEYHKK